MKNQCIIRCDDEREPAHDPQTKQRNLRKPAGCAPDGCVLAQRLTIPQSDGLLRIGWQPRGCFARFSTAIRRFTSPERSDRMNDLLHLLLPGETLSKTMICDALSMPADRLEREIAKLRERGYAVETGEGGIRLAQQTGSLLPETIRRMLQTTLLGQGEILYAPEMDSTNTHLKREAQARALATGSIAVCDRQTAGKGRLQRVWETPEPGESLTVSLLLRPKLPPEQWQLITLAAAVAAAAAIEDFRFAPGIKWPNDVVLNGRKCVGILSELATDAAGDRFVVAGVGFNVNQKTFPEALSAKATSLCLEGGHAMDRCALLCRYLWHMERVMDALEQNGMNGWMPAYASRSVTLARRVEVIGTTERFFGTAERIDETGALFVRDDQGVVRRVLSADVSVRGVMGYV